MLLGWTGSLGPGMLDEIARVPTVAVMRPAGRLPGSFDRALYNNPAILDLIDPTPATLDIRAELIRRHAIRQLLWRIANPDDGCSVTLTVEPDLIPAPAIDG